MEQMRGASTAATSYTAPSLFQGRPRQQEEGERGRHTVAVALPPLHASGVRDMAGASAVLAEQGNPMPRKGGP